jgi:hypothetical protein
MKGAWPMEPDAKQKGRVAALKEEMDKIHFLNHSYWQLGGASTFEDRAEYQRRLDRLEEIREELAQPQSGRGAAE